MKTDPQLYTIFSICPLWVFELTGLDSPGECEMKAVSLKALNQASDAVIYPKAPDKPLTVVEFQFQPDDAIYTRTVIEMALLQQEHNMRAVQGVIFFRYPSLDPQTEPWCHVVDSFQLRDVLESLAERDPTHPLVAVFRPVLLSNEETLEKQAGEYYNQIKNSTLAESVKSTLLDVFVNWLEQRLKDKSKEEIEKMLLGELPDLRETQSGKDLIKIGKAEGKAEGKIEGKAEGKIEGKQEALVLVMEAKFGTLSPDVRDRVAKLTSAEKLTDLLRQTIKSDSIDQLQW